MNFKVSRSSLSAAGFGGTGCRLLQAEKQTSYPVLSRYSSTPVKNTWGRRQLNRWNFGKLEVFQGFASFIPAEDPVSFHQPDSASGEAGDEGENMLKAGRIVSAVRLLCLSQNDQLLWPVKNLRDDPLDFGFSILVWYVCLFRLSLPVGPFTTKYRSWCCECSGFVRDCHHKGNCSWPSLHFN